MKVYQELVAKRQSHSFSLSPRSDRSDPGSTDYLVLDPVGMPSIHGWRQIAAPFLG